ncbi:MAG: hypothetical protein LUD79_02540 [Oscillospiraceae bacterium]|nr:hypothetical protein [Oscillospiraceae bacterium]
MQDINVIVSGGIDININFGFKANQTTRTDANDAMMDETLRQLDKLLQEERQDDQPLSDEDEEDSDVEYEEYDGIPQNGVLFRPCDIVMVVDPECGATAMTVEDSREVLDVFEGDEVGCLFPLLDLMMTFKPDSVAAVNGKKYLIGTAVVFSTVGRITKSLDGDDIHLVKRILEEQCETIVVNGQPVKALPL